MSTSVPLQILLFRHPSDDDVAPYENAVVRAVAGGKDVGGYIASGEDLGIELRFFSSAPPVESSPGPTLDGACHTLTVVLISRTLLDTGDDALWDWLQECWTSSASSHGRHGALAVAPDEDCARRFTQKKPALGRLQILQTTELGEQALRPALLAMLVLHRCRQLLAAALPPAVPGEPAGNLRLFISHAKADGLPLAQALMYQVGKLGWLSSFYDVRDLPPGSDWHAELERGVGSSLIVMLRTEIYDSRYWCQQEVLWADEYAVPAVLVDARTDLNHAAASLPFERVPVVRIPDGNLLRVLFAALREGLRFLHFARRIEEMRRNGELPTPLELRVFSYPPSMSALLHACSSLASANATATAQATRLIMYPDPPLRAGLYEAAEALVSVYAPGTHLTTPHTLAATKAAS